MTSRLRLASFVCAALLGTVVFGGGAARAQTVIKVATLAPEGSSWMNLFHEWGRNVETHSGGKLKIKFYAGGVAGDERDAVRKMRLGQLNAAAVTAIGLGLIQSEVRVLELPLMVKSYAELDYIRNAMDAEFRKKFEEKGYVLLGWGDVGPVHIFSNTPLKSKADLAQTKLWAWTDDPLVKTMFKQLGSNGVPLGVPDVLTSLQTGLINACYGSPLSMVALQWYTKVKYMTSMQLSQAIGATVITKRDWDKLTPDLQKVVLDDSKAMEQKLLKVIRTDNEKSLATMKANGITVVESPPSMVKEFEEQALALRPLLEKDPVVYTHEFRTKVEKLLADFRAGKK
jgi:TRAP-type C4-dicarboxylate transport system substrate-binding protein